MRTLTLLLLASCWLMTGCSSLPQRVPVRITVLTQRQKLTTPIEVLAGGRAAELRWEEVDSPEGPFVHLSVVLPEVALRRASNTVDYLPDVDLKLRVLTPCGWLESPIAARGGRESYLREQLDKEGKITISGELPIGFRLPPKITLVVDKRGIAAKDLSVGEIRFRLSGNDYDRLETFAATCEAGAIVKVDGAVVGSLPPKVVPRQGQAYYPDALIDLAGTHCYTYQTVKYGRGASQGPAEPAIYIKQHVHRIYSGLSSAFLFEHAPERVTVKMPAGMAAFDLRGELLAMKCP